LQACVIASNTNVYNIWTLQTIGHYTQVGRKIKLNLYIACAILITIKFKMSLVGNFSTCSVCGKRRIIAKQLSKVLSKQNREDVYLECKECAAIPIWDTNTKDGNQKTFDHYQ
jgi:RNase P subunit RPR2